MRAALERLVQETVLTDEQRHAVLAAVAAEEQAPRPTPAKLFAEIAAYVGAGLLLGGFALVVAASWDSLGRAGGVGVFIVVALGLMAGAVALAGGMSGLFATPGVSLTPRTRLATALLVLSALAATAAVGVGLPDGNSDSTWVIASAVGSVVAILGYVSLPSMLGMLACAGFGSALVIGFFDVVTTASDGWIGIGLCVLGGVWFALTRAGAFVPAWSGYSVAVLISIVGAQTFDFYDERWTPWLTVLVAVVAFVLYAFDRLPVLVIGGAGALALAVLEAVVHWTDGALTASLAVLTLGALVLAAGAVFLARANKSPS